MVSQVSGTPILSPAAPRLAEDYGVRPPIIIVAGPTACGKSALALKLAEVFQGIIINADSMQMYRDLSLLTAKPSATDMERVPHRLYSILYATETCSAAHWLALAHSEIENAYVSGKLPIVVGGTGLYLETLRHGLALVPEIPATVRAETRVLMTAIGPAAFHDELAKRDPVMATRLHPSDTQRMQRAWEVITTTGCSLSYWWQKKRIDIRGRFCVLLLMPKRKVLQESCNKRFVQMVKVGGISEVAALLAQNLPHSCPIMRALGVAALTDYIQGRSTLENAILAGQLLTRRYAKRQCTWFRHHLTDSLIVHDIYSAGHSSILEIFSFIRNFLLKENNSYNMIYHQST